MNKVLLFAHLRDVVGEEYLMLDAEGKTVAELKSFISEKYGIENFGTVMSAINEEFTTNEEIIKKGDVIALIPPVSGG